MTCFSIKLHLEYGYAVYVAHSMNQWSVQNSIKLKYTDNDIWIGRIDSYSQFEYKYIVADFHDPTKNTKWENGLNRKSSSETEFQIDQWEKRNVIMKLKVEQHIKGVIIITGDCQDLQLPKKMEWVKSSTQGSKYIATLSLSLMEIEKGFNYQYHVFTVDKKGNLSEFVGQNRHSKFSKCTSD